MLMNIFKWYVALIVILFLMLLTKVAFADDGGWYCENDSSKREGDTFLACGIGDAGDESRARLNALNNAIEEFTLLCNLSDDCRGHQKVVDVKRTTCKQLQANYMGYGTNWKCVRAIEVTISK